MLYNYRGFCKNDNSLVSYEVLYKETSLFVKTDKNFSTKVLKFIIEARKPIEKYILKNPEFCTSLTPIKPKSSMPTIVRKMCETTSEVGVGPMASVAGAVAEYVGTKMLKYSKNVIIENGGDIFAHTIEPLKVGIYAGENSVFSNKIAVVVKLPNQNLGVCTSSGKVGHSLSFGKADVSMIVSSSAIFSDALATATANMVKIEKDVPLAVEFAKKFDKTLAVCVIKNKTISFWAKDGCCEVGRL